MQGKKIFLVSLPLFFSLATSCKNKAKQNDATSPNEKAAVTNTQEKIDIYKSFTDFAATANDFNTGASFTFQCYNNSQSAHTLTYGSMQKNGNKVTEHTLFQIGSNSKSFLAVVALQLEEEGVLNIEHTVGTYLADYPLWQNITLKQLLNMTSGIVDYAKEASTPQDFSEVMKIIKNNPFHKFTYDELLSIVKDKPVSNKLEFNYSNTNYVLLAKIIEKITNNSLKNEVYKRIIKPLNLKHTFYIEHLIAEDIPSDYHAHLAIGYFTFPEKKDLIFPEGAAVSHHSLSWAQGAGSMVATSEDLNTYIQALFSSKLLSAKQLVKFLTPVDTKTGQLLPTGVSLAQPSGYGLGIKVIYDPALNDVIYAHSGGTLGFTAFMSYLPRTKISFTKFFNSTFFIHPRLDNYIINLPKNVADYCK